MVITYGAHLLLSDLGDKLALIILGIVMLGPGYSNQTCLQRYSNPANQIFCCDNAHVFHQLSCIALQACLIRMAEIKRNNA